MKHKHNNDNPTKRTTTRKNKQTNKKQAKQQNMSEKSSRQKTINNTARSKTYIICTKNADSNTLFSLS